MRRLGLSLLLAGGLFAAGMASVFADNPHSGGSTGQPNVECESFPGHTPGNSMASQGAAFNPNGTGHNAYEAAGAPSQYDVACFQQAQNH